MLGLVILVLIAAVSAIIGSVLSSTNCNSLRHQVNDLWVWSNEADHLIDRLRDDVLKLVADIETEKRNAHAVACDLRRHLSTVNGQALVVKALCEDFKAINARLIALEHPRVEKQHLANALRLLAEQLESECDAENNAERPTL